MWSLKHVDMRAYDYWNMWTEKHVNIKSNEHRSMSSSKQVIMWAFYYQSNNKYEWVINKACEQITMWSWLLACSHRSIHAYENLSNQVHILLTSQSPQHSSTIVNAFRGTNVHLHDHFSLRTNRHFIIRLCANVCG